MLEWRAGCWSITCPWCGFWAKLRVSTENLPARVRCAYCRKRFLLEEVPREERESAGYQLRATGLPDAGQGALAAACILALTLAGIAYSLLGQTAAWVVGTVTFLVGAAVWSGRRA